jgi:transcriptional regulator with XRE-family HTH domain
MTQQAPLRTERRVLPGAVRRIRELQCKTQAEIATLAGPDAAGKPLSFTTVSHIEAGRRQPSLDVMCRLANGLGVDLDDFTYFANVYVADEGRVA